FQTQDERRMFTPAKAEQNDDPRVCVSVGILGWNEEDAIEAALDSLRQQSLFSELAERGLRAEILLVANGCTDRTAEVAREFLARNKMGSFKAQAATAFDSFASDSTPLDCTQWRVMEIAQRGKNNAWNLF